MNDMNYQLVIQPRMYEMFARTERDLNEHYQVSTDDFLHAMFNWLMDKTVGNPPLWMIQELHELYAAQERQRTIEGEVGE